MSGSGGNFGSNTFAPPSAQPMTCENLKIILSIVRPDFKVFDTRELDNLGLTMFVEDGTVMFEYNNQFVGYGSHYSINQLVDCLEQGYTYSATIISFEWDSFIRVTVQ